MLSDDLLLLKIIECNGDISLLLNRGLTFSQIANKLAKQIKENNVFVNGFEMHLTKKGKTTLEDHYKEANIRKKDSWIVPQDYHYHKPIDKSIVLLPKKL